MTDNEIFVQHKMMTDKELLADYSRLKAVDLGIPNFGTYILLQSITKELAMRGIEVAGSSAIKESQSV